MIRSSPFYQDKNFIGIVILTVLGFFYRWYLASLAYGTLVFDSLMYSELAKDFLAGGTPIDCCSKNLGYSAFLAGVYAFYGVENIPAVRFVHIVIDLITAFLVYAVASRVFTRKTASVSFVLYIINPFTASYTGLLLPETVTILYVTMIAYIITRRTFAQNTLLWGVLGLTLGLLLFTRLSLLFFVFIFMASFAFFIVTRRRMATFLFVVVSSFLIANSYSLVTYFRHYGKLTLVPPYTNTFATLYTTFYHGRYPEVEGLPVHPEYTRVVLEYFSTPLEEKRAFSQKYQALFWQKLKTDWPLFLRNVARNSIWLWDKDHLYTYSDPFYPSDRLFLRITNMLLLILAAAGVLLFIMKNVRSGLKHPLVLFTVLLFSYITVFFSLVSNESRHSLIFYPHVFIWVGYALSTLWKRNNTS